MHNASNHWTPNNKVFNEIWKEDAFFFLSVKRKFETIPFSLSKMKRIQIFKVSACFSKTHTPHTHKSAKKVGFVVELSCEWQENCIESFPVIAPRLLNSFDDDSLFPKFVFLYYLLFFHRFLLIRSSKMKHKMFIVCSSNVSRVLFQWLEKLYKINICIKWLNTCVKLCCIIIFYDYHHSYYAHSIHVILIHVSIAVGESTYASITIR